MNSAHTLLPLVLPAHEWGKKKKNPPSEGYIKEFHHLPAALTFTPTVTASILIQY